MMYDVIIIGCGVIGASCARELSKYNLKTLILEKNNDVGDEASGANSGIIHSGYDPIFNSLKAKYNIQGNSLFTQLTKDLDISFIRNGSLTVCLEDEYDKLYNLYQNGLKNNLDLEIVDYEKLHKLEPLLHDKFKYGLLARSSGIINPFELVVGLCENAIDNGVELKLNSKVINILKCLDYYKVITENNTYESKVVINASGVYSGVINNLINPKKYTVKPRIGEYFVLDKMDYVKHTIFRLPSASGKGVLVTPTTSSNYLIGPSSEFVDDFESKRTTQDILNSILDKAKDLLKEVRTDKIIRQFSGIRSVCEDDFIIDEVNGFISLVGIASPGLSASIAIAREVSSLVSKTLPLTINKTFNPRRKKILKLNRLSKEEKEKLINDNKDLSNFVCFCEEITLLEVKDCLNRSCPPTTIKGVKKRIRPGFGRCQGSFCESNIIDALSKHNKVKKTEINYSNLNTTILKGELNE